MVSMDTNEYSSVVLRCSAVQFAVISSSKISVSLGENLVKVSNSISDY